MKSINVVKSGVLTVAMLAIAGVLAVLACGPAAAPVQNAGGGESAVQDSMPVPATEAPFVLQQDGDRDGGGNGSAEQETATPTPDPTLGPNCVWRKGRVTQEWEVYCMKLGPENIESNLWKKYRNHMEEKAFRQARSEPTEFVVLDFHVLTSTEDAVDDVLDYLDDVETRGPVNSFKYDDGSGGLVSARFSLELVPEVAAIEGVRLIDEPSRGVGQSSNLRQEPVPTLTVAEVVRVDQWHDAGVNGLGVKVGVIDTNFLGFKEEVVPNLTRPVSFLCYDADRERFEGVIPVGGPVLDNFDACETLRGVQGHGTRVVADLMKTAPGVRLFITNPPNKEYLEHAVDWLTGQASGKGPHKVDIINHSVAYRWDGSGDGMSTFDTSGRRSPLRIAEDAVEREALWVNGAGNGADRTHFLVVPTFPDDGTVERCLNVQLTAGVDYEFQARWADAWPKAVIDLEIELYLGGRRVDMSTSKQSGRGSHYPLENLKHTPSASGQHCVGLSRDEDDVDPRWAQLQIYLPRTLEFPHHSSRGSLDNPAEFYDLRALAVGVARYHPPAAGAAPPAMPALSLLSSSARGPVPAYFETSRHVKPDVVGVRSLRVTTSQAAAHVSGVAALLLQAFEGDPTVQELAGAVRRHAVQYGIGHANDDWGHGAVFLPSLEAPEIKVVTHEHCAVTPNLLVWFNHPSQAGPVRFQLKAQQVGEGSAAYEGMVGGNPGRVDVFTDRGTYNVTARTCTETGHCGPEGESVEYSTVAQVCKPRWLDAVPQDEAVTLQWNPDPDATGYEIEGVAGTVTSTEHVISGLTNGTWYEYRLRSLGPGGPSDWSSSVRVAPTSFPVGQQGPRPWK